GASMIPAARCCCFLKFWCSLRDSFMTTPLSSVADCSAVHVGRVVGAPTGVAARPARRSRRGDPYAWGVVLLRHVFFFEAARPRTLRGSTTTEPTRLTP